MERTLIIGYAGGYCNARINYNYVTEKWDLDFLESNMDMDDHRYVENRLKGVKTFDTPQEAMLWVAENELGWKNDRRESEREASGSPSSSC